MLISMKTFKHHRRHCSVQGAVLLCLPTQGSVATAVKMYSNATNAGLIFPHIVQVGELSRWETTILKDVFYTSASRKVG